MFVMEAEADLGLLHLGCCSTPRSASGRPIRLPSSTDWCDGFKLKHFSSILMKRYPQQRASKDKENEYSNITFTKSTRHFQFCSTINYIIQWRTQRRIQNAFKRLR